MFATILLGLAGWFLVAVLVALIVGRAIALGQMPDEDPLALRLDQVAADRREDEETPLYV